MGAAGGRGGGGGGGAAAGGDAVGDVDKIIQETTKEAEKNNVIDMLKMTLNDIKQDERLLKFKQRTNDDGSLKKKTVNGKKVPDMFYEAQIPGIKANASVTDNMEAYCESLTNPQLVALGNIYGIKSEDREELIHKLLELQTYIVAWNSVLAKNRDKLIALCKQKSIPYSKIEIPAIADWFKHYARTEDLRSEIYKILDS